MFSRVQLFATPWTVAHQAPLSMGSSRQECWSGLLSPPQGIFPTQGLKLLPLVSFSSCTAGGFLSTDPPGKSPCEAQKLSVLMTSGLSLCSSLFVPLVSYLRILSQIQSHELYPYFLLRVLQFFNPFFINLCVWHKVRAQLHSFVGGYPVASAPFVEKNYCMISAPLSKISQPYMDVFISGLSSLLHWSVYLESHLPFLPICSW